jgi:hypothetical protein
MRRCVRLLGSALAVGIAMSAVGVTPALASYPFTTRSYYEHDVSTSTLYAQGKAAGLSGAHGVIILDFGRPAYNSSSGDYGTIDLSDHFLSNQAIENGMKAFLDAYFSYSPSSTIIFLARGINNSCSNNDPNCCPSGCGNEPPSFTTAGERWKTWVDNMHDYIAANSNYALQERATGADDMEPSWNPGFGHTQDFIDGYNSTTPAYDLWDFGSNESGYWTSSQEWYAAYSGSNWPFPEVYSSGQAGDWENLDLWSVANKGYSMDFRGVLSQYRSGYSCGYTPHDGYDDMLNQLQSHASTNQSSIDYLSNIVCHT